MTICLRKGRPEEQSDVSQFEHLSPSISYWPRLFSALKSQTDLLARALKSGTAIDVGPQLAKWLRRHSCVRQQKFRWIDAVRKSKNPTIHRPSSLILQFPSSPRRIQAATSWKPLCGHSLGVSSLTISAKPKPAACIRRNRALVVRLG